MVLSWRLLHLNTRQVRDLEIKSRWRLFRPVRLVLAARDIFPPPSAAVSTRGHKDTHAEMARYPAHVAFDLRRASLGAGGTLAAC